MGEIKLISNIKNQKVLNDASLDKTCMWYVYVLKSEKDSKIYIGYTTNLKLRLEEHKEGLVRSTKYRHPLKFIYCEVYINEKIAQKREKQLKSGKAHIALKKRLLE